MMINQWVEDAYNRDRQSFPFKQLPRHFFAETKRFGLVAGFRPPFSGIRYICIIYIHGIPVHHHTLHHVTYQ